MQDVLKKYKKNKMITNINIILASLVLAFGINFVLIDGTNIGQSLKTSVLNSESQNIKSDISLEKINNDIFVIANKNIEKVETLSFSLIYNPENINITNIRSEIGDIINLGNTPGVNSIILTSKKAVNIEKGDKLAIIDISKNEEKSENINIINSNFKDNTGEKYELSTSGITF